MDRHLTSARRWILRKAPPFAVRRLHQTLLRRIVKARPHKSRLAARTLMLFAEELKQGGQAEEALDLQVRVHQALSTRYGGDDHGTLGVEAKVAESLFQLERWDQALEAFERLERTYARLYGLDHQHQIGARLWIALTLAKMDRFDDSLRVYLPAMDALEGQVGEDAPQLAGHLMNLGNVQLQAGDRTEAIGSMRRGLDIRGRALGPDDPMTLSSLRQLAWVLAEHGELDEARIMATNLLDKTTERGGPDHPETVKAQRLVDRIREATEGR
jgi:tetratricopeptide (TPR) repeat protein